jgi:N-acetyl-anhydromuramoyl-L-alanine amidase
MTYRIFSHRIECAQYFQSPNCDARPENIEIKLIVIHGISLPPNDFSGNYVRDFFMNQLNPELHPYFKEIAPLKVSSHLYVRRNGEVQQFVPFDLRAWHAGVSCYKNESRCNDYSIGIELEGGDDYGYEPIQYAVLIDLLKALLTQYPETQKNPIVGHQHIAPGRKTDPGPFFEWEKLKQAGFQVFEAAVSAQAAGSK